MHSRYGSRPWVGIPPRPPQIAQQAFFDVALRAVVRVRQGRVLTARCKSFAKLWIGGDLLRLLQLERLAGVVKLLQRPAGSDDAIADGPHQRAPGRVVAVLDCRRALDPALPSA